MIDLHCHILPYIDDGANDWDESLEMSEIARRDGVHTIVATPHIKPGVYSPPKKLILSRVQEINQLLENKINSRDLQILPGADTYLQPDILHQIEEGTILYVGGNINSMNPIHYLLLELPDYFLFPQVKDSFAKLKDKGIIPILSHPERNAMLQRNSKLLHKLIQAGVLSQVTAMSITGEFGRDIQKFTKKLTHKDLVHIIASDAHSKDRRPPVLSRAVEATAKIIGSERAEMMVKEIPQAVIEGRKVEL